MCMLTLVHRISTSSPTYPHSVARTSSHIQLYSGTLSSVPASALRCLWPSRLFVSINSKPYLGTVKNDLAPLPQRARPCMCPPVLSQHVTMMTRRTDIRCHHQTFNSIQKSTQKLTGRKLHKNTRKTSSNLLSELLSKDIITFCLPKTG